MGILVVFEIQCKLQCVCFICQMTHLITLSMCNVTLLLIYKKKNTCSIWEGDKESTKEIIEKQISPMQLFLCQTCTNFRALVQLIYISVKQSLFQEKVSSLLDTVVLECTCKQYFHVNAIYYFSTVKFQVLVSPSFTPDQVADVMDSIMHTQVNSMSTRLNNNQVQKFLKETSSINPSWCKANQQAICRRD